MPAVSRIITSYPLEYVYGSLSADFFIGKGMGNRSGNLHNWYGGFEFFGEACDNREAAYAYGYLSHLVSDVLAHNFFVPKLISSAPGMGGGGHLYWEMKSDYAVGPIYLKIARDVLAGDHHFEPGEQFILDLFLMNGGPSIVVDVYVILDVYGLFYFWPSWEQVPDSVSTHLHSGQVEEWTILGFAWPEGAGSGEAVIWGAMTALGSYDPLTEPDRIQFTWGN